LKCLLDKQRWVWQWWENNKNLKYYLATFGISCRI